MYRTFQPTLPAGKAELVRRAEELHVVGRAEGTSMRAEVGCTIKNPAKQARRLFLYTLFKACKNIKGLIRVHEQSCYESASKNSHFSSFSQRPLAKLAGCFRGSLIWYVD